MTDRDKASRMRNEHFLKCLERILQEILTEHKLYGILRASEKISESGRLLEVALLTSSPERKAVAVIKFFLQSLQHALGRRYISVQVIVGPHPFYLIRLIKIHQPVGLTAFLSILQSMDGFADFSQSHLSRELDRLRKRGLILRLTDANYVLSEKGLHFVPDIRRKPSDVERALALGRRAW